MKFIRVLIEGWTASFRYPAFVSGFQPSLPVPPLSTIYGLLSSVKGEVVTPSDVNVGYIFSYESKAVDLEQIYEIKALTGNKPNIVRREFLTDPQLYLYVDDLNFKKYFESPHFHVLLGRSSDLAMIKSVEEVDLNMKKNVELGKTILPFGTKGAYGILQALPVSFSDTIPRQTGQTKPFILMDQYFQYEDECYYDEELDKGIWVW